MKRREGGRRRDVRLSKNASCATKCVVFCQPPSYMTRTSNLDDPCVVDKVEAERMRSITHTGSVFGVSPRSLPSSPHHVVQSSDTMIDPPQVISPVKLSRAIDGRQLGCLAPTQSRKGRAVTEQHGAKHAFKQSSSQFTVVSVSCVASCAEPQPDRRRASARPRSQPLTTPRAPVCLLSA